MTSKGSDKERISDFYTQKRDAQQAAFAATPLSQVMDICGFTHAAEKSDSRHTKYNVNGVLFHLEKTGNRFSILTGDKASFMKGKPGGIGAINLYRAVQEFAGNKMTYPDACNSLAEHVCPETLDDKFQVTEEGRKRMQEAYAKNQERIRIAQENEEKERIAKRIPPEKLPQFNAKGLKPAYRFLTETRLLPKDIAEGLLVSRTVYPTLVEQTSRSGKSWKNYHLIAPSINIENGENYGYADITLGLDKNKSIDEECAWVKTFAKNEGSFTDSVVPITAGTEKLNKVVVTESFLDGVAYGVINGFPENEAVYSTAGARVPHDVIAFCKKNGYELHLALDNDIAGRRVTGQSIQACKDAGVKCSFSLPENGKIELCLDPDNPKSASYFKSIQTHLEKEGKSTDWEIDAITQEASIVVENTRSTCRLLHEMRKSITADKMEREKLLNKDRYPNYPHGVPKYAKDVVKARKGLEISFRNKDWNDNLRTQIMSEFEHPQDSIQPTEDLEIKHPSNLKKPNTISL